MAKRQKVEELKLTLEQISTPACTLCVTTMQPGQPGYVYHVGRALTSDMVDFMDAPVPDMTEHVFAPGETIPDWGHSSVEAVGTYGFRFITGPSGTGKSTSLSVVAKFLYKKYASEKPVKRRIVFVDGDRLRNSPEKALYYAIRAAGEDDAGLTPDGLLGYLIRELTVRYTIVVDNGNKVPRSSNAASFLASLVPPCVVVFCVSGCSEWTKVIRHPKTERFMIVNRGLEGDELEAFCTAHGIKLAEVDTGLTGTNPRLLVEYTKNRMQFDEVVTSLEVEAKQYFTETLADKWQRDELVQVMTGTTKVSRLNMILNSKCLYAGVDGTLECVSDGLFSFCLAQLAALIQEGGIERRFELIGVFIGAVMGDMSMSRIGWNAQEAVLLALRFLDLDICYAEHKSVKIVQPAFEVSEGQMLASVLSGGLKTLPRVYVPKRFNHMGLDLYLELQDTIIAFQISVANNAEARHRQTVEKAEELFRAAKKRLNVLIYVIPCAFSSEPVESEDLSYYYVKMPFGNLSSRLKVIDERLTQIRELSTRQDDSICWKCQKVAGDTLWVQCDACLLWYHQSCVGYDPNSVVNLRSRRLPREFECEDCKDYMKRKARQAAATELRQAAAGRIPA